MLERRFEREKDKLRAVRKLRERIGGECFEKCDLRFENIIVQRFRKFSLS